MDDKDILNKNYNSCGCISISKLNLIDNIVNDYNIQLCKTHYLLSYDKNNFKFNKKNKLYTLIEKKNTQLKKKKISFNNSYENLKTLISNSINNETLYSHKLIKFGKYKNKTYEYVYKIDKLYCYHLAFWVDINSKNTNIINFINYIKLKVN